MIIPFIIITAGICEVSSQIPWYYTTAIGFLLSSIFSVFFREPLSDFFKGVFVRGVGRFHLSLGKKNIAGNWSHVWEVESKNFDSLNETHNVLVRQIYNRIYARYEVLGKKGTKNTYEMLGEILQDHVITGIWRDIKKGNRYHGCFQLRVKKDDNEMEGFWTGIADGSIVKTGKWTWKRE